MNEDIIKGKWKQMKGKVKEEWGKLTDDDVDQINGQGEQLIGKLQELYGYSREEAEKEARRFADRYQDIKVRPDSDLN